MFSAGFANTIWNLNKYDLVIEKKVIEFKHGVVVFVFHSLSQLSI